MMPNALQSVLNYDRLVIVWHIRLRFISLHNLVSLADVLHQLAAFKYDIYSWVQQMSSLAKIYEILMTIDFWFADDKPRSRTKYTL